MFLWALARLKLEFGSYWHIFSNHFTYKIHNEIIQQKQTKQCQGNVLNDNEVKKKKKGWFQDSQSVCKYVKIEDIGSSFKWEEWYAREELKSKIRVNRSPPERERN